MLLIKGFTSSKLAKFGRLFKLVKISFISLIPASPVIALAFFEFSKIKFVLSSLPFSSALVKFFPFLAFSSKPKVR